MRVLISETELEDAVDPEALRAAKVAEAIHADHDASEETDEIRRIERLSGARCACCDDPLPAAWTGDECASCAEINS